MKRYLSMSAALLLGSTSLALAATETVEGEIVAIDEAAQTVTIGDNPEVQVPQHDLLGLQVGDRVILHVEERDGRWVATNVVHEAGAGTEGVPPATATTGAAVQQPATDRTVVEAERPASDIGPGIMGDTWEGEISGIDPQALTVTVDDSPDIHVPERELVGLQMGQRVIINVEEQDGRLIAHNIVSPTGPTQRGGAGDQPGAAAGTGDDSPGSQTN
jgi:bifunctional DNA-binding transcriptional regulator/antitoxin component of YhaV-PrlF toxin-antitoxin module